MFDTERSLHTDFWRTEMYRQIDETLTALGITGTGVEFGGTNGVLQSMLPNVQFETRHFPAYDAGKPESWEKSWDVVLFDQVLEHVARPWEVFELMGQHTNKLAIVTVPFMVAVHPYPIDYWRMSKACLAELAAPYFSKIITGSWGNRTVTKWCADHFLVAAVPKELAEMRATLADNDESLPLMVWGIFQK